MALDMRWSWNREADVLWQKLDPELWEATGNPWLLLRDVSQKRLQALAQDTAFVAEIKRLHQMRDLYFRQSTWFERNYGELKLNGIAFFCMEFGLSEALPIYSAVWASWPGTFSRSQATSACQFTVSVFSISKGTSARSSALVASNSSSFLTTTQRCCPFCRCKPRMGNGCAWKLPFQAVLFICVAGRLKSGGQRSFFSTPTIRSIRQPIGLLPQSFTGAVR